MLRCQAAVRGRSHIHGCHCHSSARGIQSGHTMAVAVMVPKFRFVFQQCCQGHSPLQILCEQLCARCPFCCDSHKHRFNKPLPPPPALLQAGMIFG